MSEARPPADQWWSINGETLLDALKAAHGGADPDMVYLELFANSDTEPDDEDDQ